MNQHQQLTGFVSYAHNDEDYLDQLKRHLANLEREGLIQWWHDRAIDAGDQWEREIFDTLDQADVIVLLISADFNDSDFCRNVEMTRAIQRYKEGTAVVIPVVVRPVEALPSEIRHIQSVPKDLQPITSFQPEDQGYAEVARSIRKVVEGLSAKSNTSVRSSRPTEARSPEMPPRDTQYDSHGPVVVDLGGARPVAVCLEFRPSGQGYEVDVRIGFDSASVVTLPHVRLGTSEPLELGDQVQTTLGDLVTRLINFQQQDLAFEERGQLEIGRKLFDQTVGRIEPLAGCDQVDLRIITDDEHLMRLPWPLLNRRGIFLIHEAWCTSLSTHGTPREEVSLASHGNVLVISPDPYPDAPTSGADHVNDLRALLSGEDYDLGSPEKLVEVRTWQQFNRAVAEKAFDVVYFYGHGEGDRERTRLVFEASGGSKPEPRSTGDFANVLRKMNPTPVLAYINCCYGDSGGLLGIGNQLGHFIPSVVTNRTVAAVSAARTQACSFFRQVLLDSLPPHEAVTSLYHELPGDDLDGIQPEWFTPVHHANYARWHHVSPRDARKPRIHPNWRWLVDRKNQYGTTTERLRGIVNRQIKKRAAAIVVHGAAGNGLRHFQERIRCFVHQSVDIDGRTYKPSWPKYAAKDGQDPALRDRAFMQIIETCGHQTVPDLLRDFRRGVVGNKTLTVFNHPIVSSPKVMNSTRLFEYLEWWNHQLETAIDDENLFFLFAFYFEVPGDKRKKFQDSMKASRRNARLQHTDVQVLMPLTEIDEDDLLQFIDDHELFIPESSRVEIAEHIIRETGGEYERAIALLELIVHDQYHRLLHELQRDAPTADSDAW